MMFAPNTLTFLLCPTLDAELLEEGEVVTRAAWHRTLEKQRQTTKPTFAAAVAAAAAQVGKRGEKAKPSAGKGPAEAAEPRCASEGGEKAAKRAKVEAARTSSSHEAAGGGGGAKSLEGAKALEESTRAAQLREQKALADALRKSVRQRLQQILSVARPLQAAGAQTAGRAAGNLAGAASSAAAGPKPEELQALRAAVRELGAKGANKQGGKAGAGETAAVTVEGCLLDAGELAGSVEREIFEATRGEDSVECGGGSLVGVAYK